MKKLLLILAVSCALVPALRGQEPGAAEIGKEVAAAVPQAGADSVFDASSVFVNLPAGTLDLLTLSERLDLLDYYKVDSIAEVVNVMEGFSHLVRPVTDDYLKVQITPVSTLTVKILPVGKGRMAVAAYTVGDSIEASDTDLKFFDEKLVELPASRFIKLASTADFFNFEGVDRSTRKEMLDLVPFPTVEYTFEPESDRLHARLTVHEFLGKETLDKISPYLQRDRWYKWTGKKFRLEK